MRLTFWFVAGLVAMTSGALMARQTPTPDRLGPQVGERIPVFVGVDQFGRQQSLATIADEAGAFVVFFRSADW